MHGALNQSGEWFKKIRFWCRADLPVSCSLRASSPVWASEASLARTREPASERAVPRSRVLARLTSFAQIGELARRLVSCG